MWRISVAVALVCTLQVNSYDGSWTTIDFKAKGVTTADEFHFACGQCIAEGEWLISESKSQCTCEGQWCGAVRTREDDSVFKTRMVALHNEYRAQHGVPGLEWDDELQAIAQKYMSNHVVRMTSFRHNWRAVKTHYIGENMFAQSNWTTATPGVYIATGEHTAQRHDNVPYRTIKVGAYKHKLLKPLQVDESSDTIIRSHSRLRFLAESAVRSWYNELYTDYDYNDIKGNIAANKKNGHFVLVVWKGTTHVGCARGLMANGWTAVICNYRPGAAAKSVKRHQENVLPRLDGKHHIRSMTCPTSVPKDY